MTIEEIKKAQADALETSQTQGIATEARASCVVATAVYEVALQLALLRESYVNLV